MVSLLLSLLSLFSVVKLRKGYIIQTKQANYRLFNPLVDHQLRSVSLESESIQSANAVEGLLFEFDRQIRGAEYDAQVTSRLHMDAILTLIKSDVQDRDDDDGSESHPFPQSYMIALLFIVNQTSALNLNHSPLYTAANMISKKEGINQVLKSLKSIKSQLMSSREIVEVKRKTERVLSQLLTLLIAYNSCLLSGTEKDLLYFTKSLLEKTPIHDRHFALLLLSRGLLAPPYNVGRSSYIARGNNEPLSDVASVVRLHTMSLSQSFKKNMAAVGISQPSLSARMLYPFASAAMRAFTASTAKTSAPKQKNDDWFSNDSGNPDAAEEKRDDVYHVADSKLCLLLEECMREDTRAEKSRQMTGSGDEVLSTLRRWVCDLAATHFMNDEEGLFSTRDSLPEEIRKNTVAMELLCTERAFCDGKKRDRARFVTLFEEVGNYLEVMSSLREVKKEESATSGLVPSLQAKYTFRVKKTIAAISATKFLPRTHKLRVGMESGGSSTFLGAYNAHRKSKVNAVINSARTLTLAGSESSETDDMWATQRAVTRVVIAPSTSSKVRARKVEEDLDDGDDMWASASPKELEKRKKLKKETAAVPSPSPDTFDLVPQVDEYLLQIIADVLRVDESIVLQQHVKDEVDYVFSTWRRPHLLLDYYRMHSSTPEIQSNFRRFLSALFGVSGETVEDIRYSDAGNKRHFDLLPPELAARWIEGVSRSGEILPGYCDPQTLFMIGEDSNTCMGIRARQKGSNRGLLSMLLHGNCRILGAKDCHGRLTARAVSRLLIDDITGLPVLYVETPYGSVDEESYVEVYDQAAALGGLLQIPVVYASPPSPSLYVMGPRELPAVQAPSDAAGNSVAPRSVMPQGADWMVEEEEDDEDSEDIDIQDVDQVVPMKEKVIFNKLLDYTEMASHVWIDGIRDPSTGRYLCGQTPLLFITKRAIPGENGKEEDSLTMGGRPPRSLEKMQSKGVVQLQPAVARSAPSGKKVKIEEVLGSQFIAADIQASATLDSVSSAVSSFTADSSAGDASEDEDDDFFGIANTLLAYKRRPQKPSTAAPPMDAVSLKVDNLSSASLEVEPVAAPITPEEIEDNRKSKKQRVVSVQARLAERQRLLSETLQRRQSITSANSKEKEEQIKEYQLRRAPLNTLPLEQTVDPVGGGSGAESRAASQTVTRTGPRITVKEPEPVPEEEDDDSDGLWA